MNHNERTIACRTTSLARLLAMGYLVLNIAWPALGAELQLRSEIQCRGPMVTLGDMAEIRTGDALQRQNLAAIDLFPAPPSGGKRFVRFREIQDMLLLRGINLIEHRFSGPSQATVFGADNSTPDKDPQAASPSLVKRAERQLNEAIEQYLRQRVSGSESWNVSATLAGPHAQLVTGAGNITVSGGAPPWLGAQRFEVTVTDATGATRLVVPAQVAAVQQVVVAARAMGRGEVIAAADVQLVPGSTETTATAFHAIEEVVGQEASQVIPAGKVIDHEALRAPLVVHRGEPVTVFARSAGIRVRTVGRAREDGSVGDLIAVESMEARKSFFARVCGIQEVEIYARAVQAHEPANADVPVRAVESRRMVDRAVERTGFVEGDSPRQVSNARLHLEADQGGNR